MYKNTAKHRRLHRDYDFGDDLEKIKKALFAASSHVKDHAGGMLQEARGKSAELQENVTSYASKRPLKVLGTGLVLGVAIGYLINKFYE